MTPNTALGMDELTELLRKLKKWETYSLLPFNLAGASFPGYRQNSIPYTNGFAPQFSAPYIPKNPRTSLADLQGIKDRTIDDAVKSAAQPHQNYALPSQPNTMTAEYPHSSLINVQETSVDQSSYGNQGSYGMTPGAPNNSTNYALSTSHRSLSRPGYGRLGYGHPASREAGKKAYGTRPGQYAASSATSAGGYQASTSGNSSSSGAAASSSGGSSGGGK